jgi:hypothetical protein
VVRAWFGLVDLIKNCSMFNLVLLRNIIIGHMDEHVVGHRWRSDHRFDTVQSSRGLPMKAAEQEYFACENIYMSGHYSTKRAQNCINEIAEKIMFSIVCPVVRF